MSQESAELVTAGSSAAARAARSRTSPVGDRIFMFLLHLSAWLVLGVVIALFLVLLQRSWPAISKVGFSAFTLTWDPNGGHFGVLSFIYGTIVASAIALLVAGPIGIGAALFLAELAPRKLATPVAMLIELLAAVPSVVYGLWALFALPPAIRLYIGPTLQQAFGFLPIFQGSIYGVGALAGGLI